jgi:hypothetical protein
MDDRSRTGEQGRRRTRDERPNQPAIPGYHLVECLGQGAAGSVHRAVQLSMQREVAVRLLPLGLARSPLARAAFIQEARAAGAVHHPNLVACLDVGEQAGQLYLASELMAHGDLTRVLAEHGGRLAPKHALALAVDAARALEALHRAGLVHGAVRARNLFVGDDGGAQLGDLGLAAMKAELAEEDQPTADGDLAALSRVLQHLLTGRAPDATRPRADPSLPRDVAAVITRAGEGGYASAGQLREDFERLQYDFAPVHALASEAQESTQRHARKAAGAAPSTATLDRDAAFMVVPPAAVHRQRRWLVAGLVLGAAALGSVVLMIPRVPARPPKPPAPVAAGAAAQTTVPRPAWAGAAGEDLHGRWAEIGPVTGLTVRLRWCPAGRFTMGSATGVSGRREDEEPVQVTLSRPFWLSACEVTQGEYQALMQVNPSEFAGDARRPVENVSWHDAQEWLHRLASAVPGLHPRLPSEAEWEYACRAGASGEPEPAALLGVGWFAEGRITSTQPVGALPANAWGLHDMHGNVMEWCQDHYGPYPRGEVTDPLGFQGVSRVVRGGSWTLPALEGRPGARSRHMPVAHFFHLGFRFAVDD